VFVSDITADEVDDIYRSAGARSNGARACAKAAPPNGAARGAFAPCARAGRRRDLLHLIDATSASIARSSP